MRTLSTTLLAAQKAAPPINARVKLVLTYGEDSYTYNESQILDIKEMGDGPLQSFTVILNNADKSLTDIDLQGYDGILSYGADKEYSDCPPVKVISQEFESTKDKLICTLTLVGICNLMAMDKARASCMPRSEKNGTATSTMANHLIDTTESQFKASDVGKTVHNTTDDTYASITEYNSQSNLTLDADIMADGEDYEIWTEGAYDTVKTLVNSIIGATLEPFASCKAYEVVWKEGYDTLADTYRPKDAYRIYTGNNRLSKINRLLDYTKNVIRAEADGKLHIFKPTTSGESYDYEYSLAPGQHQFFAKALRNRLVIPNQIKVYSREDDDPKYVGYATDEKSYARLPNIEFKFTYLESNEQAEAIAEAILVKAQMWCEAGSANVPMNIGQEVYDFVRVVDAKEGDERAGNIGRFTRHYNVTKNEWSMGFAFGDWQNARKALDQLGITADDLENYFSRLSVGTLYAEKLLAKNMGFYWLDPDNTIASDKLGPGFLDNLPDGEQYVRTSTWNMEFDEDPESPTYEKWVLKLDEHTAYTPGYDPTTKRRNFTSTPTPPYDIGDMWHDADVVKRCITDRATGEYQASDWILVNVDQIGDGAVFQRVKSASLTAEGLVLMDEVQEGTFGKIQKASLTAAGLVILDQTIDGNYKKLRSTDVLDGHIRLTSYTMVSGEWYDNKGVLMDSDFGIRLYGGQVALSTHPTHSNAVNNTNIQCYVGTDGKIYAGAGKVWLSSSGLTIKGEYLTFLNDSGGASGTIYGSSGDLWIDSYPNNLRLYGSIIHLQALTQVIIDANASYGVDMSDGGFIALPTRTSDPTGYGGRMYYNTNTTKLRVYAEGAWKSVQLVA